jgi:cell division protein FtsL
MMLRQIGLMVLVVTVLASAVAVIDATHLNRKTFVKLQELQKQRDEMEIQWGKLQLEQGAWTTHGRVEQLASKELDMIMPPSQSVVIVQP